MTQQNGRDVDVPDEDGEGGGASLPGAMGAAVPQRAAVASEPASSTSPVDSAEPASAAFSADSADSAGSPAPADPAVTSVFSVASIVSAASVPAMPEVPDIPVISTVLTSASESVNGRDSADSSALGNPVNPSGSANHADLANPQNPGDEPKPETLMIEQVEQHDAPVGAAASPNPPQISLAPIKKLRAQFNPLADGLVYLVVFLGGFVGTAVRYGVSALFPSSGTEFPVDTFIANVAACFLFSLLAETMAHASWIRRRTRQLLSRGLGLGLCGGLSTMSTMAVESLADMLDHEPWMAVSYMVASVVVGTICCVAGVLLAHVLTASRAAKSLRRMSGGSKASHNPRRANPTSVGGGNPASGHAQTSTGGDSTAANGVAAGSDPNMPASFEPTPITAEIPLVPDPVTGEVH